MLGTILLATAALSLVSGGFAAGCGWRIWGDDAEFEPGTITLAALLLVLGAAFGIAGATL